MAALGTEYFENLLPDIIRNCSHSKAPVRDGYLTLFKVSSFFKLFNGYHLFSILYKLYVCLMSYKVVFRVVSAKITRCAVPKLLAASATIHLRW